VALRLTGQFDVLAGGTLRITDSASGEQRTATGLWHLRASGRDHQIDVILTLPSERYVAAVLSAEAAPDEPAQSLRALAVLARTYALDGAHYTAAPGHLAANLCDSTECQAMLPGRVSPAIENATQATAGETLWFGGHRAEVFFSQNCGGMTEDGGAIWPRLSGVPYLRSHVDPYCVRRDTARWHAEVPLTKLATIAQAEGWRLPANLVAASAKERSASHRVLRVTLTGSAGDTMVVSASALRFGIGRTLGWNLVRSDAYEVGVRHDTLVFDGRGHGHGVGLCQDGAMQMAAEGKTERDILAFYFPQTEVRILAGDRGWQETQLGSIVLRATQPLTAERKAVLEKTWTEAKSRLPPQRAITPEIVFAPTTEVFRQITSQPGWAMASTQGGTIVLQPDAVLFAPRRNASATMLHEMLHVLVEAESNERTPLWLREGLVEALTNEASSTTNVAPANPISVGTIDSLLAQADSLRASEQAHRAATARVRSLIARYGLSAVRGWLSSGVPSGAA
jgi:stage II sporulation protein D